MLMGRKNSRRPKDARRHARSMVQSVARNLDASGRFVIGVNLQNVDPVSPLSFGEIPTLSEDLYDYVEEKANLVPAEIPLHIEFHGGALSQKEQEAIRSAFRDHYTRKKYDRDWDLAACARRTTRLFVLGAVLILLYLGLSASGSDNLFLEILSIFGSFAVWEAADELLLSRPEIRRAYDDACQFEDAMLSFCDS